MEQFEVAPIAGEALPGSGYIGAQPVQPGQPIAPMAETVGTQAPLNAQAPEAQQPPALPTVDDYAITLPDSLPEEARDMALVGRFKQFCADSGLSPEQAQKAVNFYLGEQDSATQGMHEQCETQLRALWRERYPERLSKARQACVAFDKRMGGRLMPLLNAGLGNHPVVAEFMAEVGASMGEDSFGGAKGGEAPNEAMSTEEFLRKVVFKNK
ncbi:hypothetical protein [Desulfovibrio cuneatus]|uniref:hypothetical protein n=1 Tax=Desulfovibrio cuneatus TaxID=159728 RepID=UPI000419F820|nr:hypothetical protein [Desulfovibrio cuneatus]